MQYKCRFEYLEEHLDGEDAGEDEVEVVEDLVLERVLTHRVLCREGDAARTDHDHDERVEEPKVHDEVAEPADAADTMTHTGLCLALEIHRHLHDIYYELIAVLAFCLI